MTVVKRIWADFADQSASYGPEKSSYRDVAPVILLVVSGTTSFVDGASRLTRTLLGSFGSAIPLCLVAFCLLCSWSAITAKRPAPGAGFAAPDRTKLLYVYGKPARWLSKAAVLLVPLMIPRNALAVWDEFSVLPTTFYGYLKSARDGSPIEDATVRVVTADQKDITHGIWRSDSTGFYIVKTKVPAKRNDTITIAVPGCRLEVRQLRREDDRWPSKAESGEFLEERPHVFTHLIQCAVER